MTSCAFTIPVFKEGHTPPPGGVPGFSKKVGGFGLGTPGGGVQEFGWGHFGPMGEKSCFGAEGARAKNLVGNGQKVVGLGCGRSKMCILSDFG